MSLGRPSPWSSAAPAPEERGGPGVSGGANDALEVNVLKELIGSDVL